MARVVYYGQQRIKELQTFVEKEIPEYTFQSLWFNRNGYGHYKMHNHHTQEIDAISGYYIEVPDKNMGRIYFETDEDMTLKRIDYYCFLLISNME